MSALKLSIGNYKLSETEQYMVDTEMKETVRLAKQMHNKMQIDNFEKYHKDFKRPELAILDIERFKTDF